MTTTDTDALTEHIRRARSLPAEWARRQDGETTMEQTERWQKRQDEQTAALVAEEVRAAKVEALREAASGLLENIDWSAGRSSYGDNDGYEASARELRALATEYETGDSDEH